jgi:hypothetical protein
MSSRSASWRTREPPARPRRPQPGGRACRSAVARPAVPLPAVRVTAEPALLTCAANLRARRKSRSASAFGAGLRRSKPSRRRRPVGTCRRSKSPRSLSPCGRRRPARSPRRSRREQSRRCARPVHERGCVSGGSTPVVPPRRARPDAFFCFRVSCEVVALCTRRRPECDAGFERTRCCQASVARVHRPEYEAQVLLQRRHQGDHVDEARHIPILSWSGLYIAPRRERQAQCSSEGWYEVSGVQPASGQGD